MLHLILGGAGSGKSACVTDCISADVAHRRPAWLIIPEQQANLSERTVLPRLPARARLTFRIAGFSRLAESVDSPAGGAVLPPDDAISALLMWQNLRELSGLLKEYGATSPRSDAHLTGLLLKTLDELRDSAITPTALENAAARLPADSALRPKLYDLALLYAAYDNQLCQLCEGQDPDPVSRLAERILATDYFAGGHVYIDSFTDFTAEEYGVIRALLRRADRVTVTVATDDHLAHQPSHDTPGDTIRHLRRLCEDTGSEIEITTLSPGQRATAPELRVLERSLWDLSLRADALPDIPEGERGAIIPMKCTNLYAEAEATALHILDLAQKGERFGDMAVIVRDTATWRGVLDAALERYHIPYYFSDKTALSEKPLSRLLISALRAVAHGWPAAELMAMLGTGLCPVDPRDLDLFEQYIDTWGITGAAFAAPLWTRNPDGYAPTLSHRGEDILSAANRVRERLMTPLLRFYSAVAGERPLPALCAALYDLMQELELSERCAALAERELAAGYLKEAGETLRVYDSVLSALSAMSAYLPDATMDAEEFAAALSLVFDATEIASVPSLHDSVIVGAADTVRVENIAACFVLGLNEGEFPRAVADEGLLADAEKQQLTELGLDIGARSEQRASNELLFLWRAMTKPSRYLYVSTQATTTDGKEKTPSVAYARLMFLFPYLKEQVRTFDLSMLTEPAASDKAPADPPTQPVSDGLYAPRLPDKGDLTPAALSLCFGDTLWLTKSRIQTFVQCPYSFFCTYMLSPRERAAARIDDDDRGNFIHAILEGFLRRCLDEQSELHLPADEEISPMAEALTKDYLATLPDLWPGELRTLHIFRRLHALTLVLLRDIVGELAHSRFVPTALELSIGDRTPGSPPPYEITLTDGRRILLGGVVDRVDVYRRGDDIYLRVIDYKSSAHDISLEDIRGGLGLQLFIYLFTLCRPERVHPAGAMYVATAEQKGKPGPVRTGLLTADPDLLSAMNDKLDPAYLAGISQKKDGTLTGKALASPDTFSALEQDVRETLRRIGEDMLGGRARRTPSEQACRFCSIKQSCPDAYRS